MVESKFELTSKEYSNLEIRKYILDLTIETGNVNLSENDIEESRVRNLIQSSNQQIQTEILQMENQIEDLEKDITNIQKRYNKKISTVANSNSATDKKQEMTILKNKKYDLVKEIEDVILTIQNEIELLKGTIYV